MSIMPVQRRIEAGALCQSALSAAEPPNAFRRRSDRLVFA
jgi:hypothetical protein